MSDQQRQIEFTALAVGVVEPDELDVDVIVLAEQADGSGRRLEVSRSTEITDQDRALEMDTYCLSNEHQAMVYGGVLSWRRDDAHISISLEEQAGAVLGSGDGYVIHVPDPDTIQLVGTCLTRLLGPPIL